MAHPIPIAEARRRVLASIRPLAAELTSMLAADALALIGLGEGELPAGTPVQVELLGGVPGGLSCRS